MPELSTVTDPNLPEPKGVAAAAADKVYISDGAGGGDWEKLVTQGWVNIADTGGSQSLTSGAWVKLTNDAAGTDTEVGYLPPGVSNPWNSVSGHFNFGAAGLEVGDSIDIRVDLDVVTSATTRDIGVRLKLATGTGTEYTHQIYGNTIPTATTTNVVVTYTTSLETSAVLNNALGIEATSDGSGDSIIVNGVYCRMVPRNPKGE